MAIGDTPEQREDRKIEALEKIAASLQRMENRGQQIQAVLTQLMHKR